MEGIHISPCWISALVQGYMYSPASTTIFHLNMWFDFCLTWWCYELCLMIRTEEISFSKRGLSDMCIPCVFVYHLFQINIPGDKWKPSQSAKFSLGLHDKVTRTVPENLPLLSCHFYYSCVAAEIHLSLVIHIYTHHGDTHIAVTPDLVFSPQWFYHAHIDIPGFMWQTSSLLLLQLPLYCRSHQSTVA